MIHYPCPKCGVYVEPFLSRKDGKALSECKEHGLFQTSIAVSKNFRIFCSKVASKPNRSQCYYTSLEEKVRKILLESPYREGIDFLHNISIPSGKRRYSVDFYIPRENIVIEVNGEVWHKMWGRKRSDRRKIQFLESEGLRIVEVNEHNFESIRRYLGLATYKIPLKKRQWRNTA